MAKGASSNRNNQTTRQTGAPATGPAPDSSPPTGTVPLANVTNADDIKAIEALSGTAGLLAKTAANTWALRTLTGSSSVEVTNGTGAAGDPTVTLGLLDTNSSHRLRLAAGSDLTADRILTLTTGDAARALSILGTSAINQDVQTTGTPQFARLGLGGAADGTFPLDAVGNVRMGAASGAAGSRIIGRGEHTSAPAGTLAVGEWEITLFDNGVAPVLRVRYNDASVIKTIDLGPLV